MKASLLVLLAVCALFASQANAKSVFAHYMMGNSYPSDVPNFANAIRLAQGAGIDGFALNIGPDEWMPDRISKMYQAATQFPGFKLFISFDMAVMSDVNVLINYVKQYVSHPNSFFYNNRYFVSTFAGESQTFGEGDVNSGWQRRFKDPLRDAGIDVFFCPAWTALGPGGMYDNHPVLDGAFSWAAWSNGNEYKTLDEDNAYMEGAKRNGKIYMAGVSPWFFTHFNYKNWIYKSEALYSTRWEEIVNLQPDLVEIITWNDYGESHYIGPIDGAFPAGSEAWTVGYDHTAWLDMASYYIQAYKAGSFPSINTDKVYFWYRPHSKNAQRNDGTGRPNNADWAEDTVVVHALLTGAAQIQVQIGGQTTTLNGNAGRNTFQVPFGEGDVVVSIQRNGQTLASKQGDKPIQNGGDLYNFNAVVGMLQNIPSVSQLLMR